MPKGPRFYQSTEDVTRQRALEALVKAAACVTIRQLPEAIFWVSLGVLRLVELSTESTFDQVVRIVKAETEEPP